MQQGAAQGQTIVAASGDSGSTACFVSPTTTNPTLAVQQALAVSYPSSSQYVTGVGGTEVDSTSDGGAYVTSGTPYWSSAQGSTDSITSALQHLPEVVWNDTVLSIQNGLGLSATGGGVSTLFTKPAWQTGVPGIPADGHRDVPDVALYASPDFVGYLFCTSDQSDWNTTIPPLQQGSCDSGFRDSATGALTVAGGTSFATPIFAGMVAILNQQKGYVSGAGLLNPTLYTLASNSATYASAFHDITTGNNFCPISVGSSFCSSSSGATSKYSAGVGYDLTTGLGSVDLANLAGVTGWPVGPTGVIGTTTSVSASNSSPNVGDNVTFTITAASITGSTVPTGTVKLSIDGGGTSYSDTSGTTATATLSNGTATYTTSFTTSGDHQLVAQYEGDVTHAASTGVASVTIQGSTFTMAATSVSVSQGASGSTTITVTPAKGYTGMVNIAPSSNTASFCYSTTSASVTGTAAVTASMSIDTNLNDCATGAAVRGHGMHLYRPSGKTPGPAHQPAGSTMRGAIGLAGLFFAGLIGWRFRRSRIVACMLALGFLGLALSGCGGGSSNSNDTPKGSYTVTLTGQDSATASITASTNLTLTVN
ncbi:MAG: Ig-like domain repeat protein, partial [Terracidiphilus sp.]